MQQGGVIPVDAVCTTFILRHGTLMPCDITGVVSVHILRRLYLKQKLQNLKGIGTNGEGHLLGMSPHKWLQCRIFTIGNFTLKRFQQMRQHGQTLGLQNLCHSDKEKKSGIKAGNTFPHLQLCA